MISREREREREEKENLSSLKIYARVFLYETTHLSYGDADLRYRVFWPFRCTLYSHSYLLYFTSRRRITSVCFNNEEIKISCVCVVLFFLLSPVFFFFDCFLSFDRRNAKNVKNQIPSDTSRHKNFAHCPPLFLFHNQRTTPQISVYGVF